MASGATHSINAIRRMQERATVVSDVVVALEIRSRTTKATCADDHIRWRDIPRRWRSPLSAARTRWVEKNGCGGSGYAGPGSGRPNDENMIADGRSPAATKASVERVLSSNLSTIMLIE